MRIRISAAVALVASTVVLGMGTATAETTDSAAPCGASARACLDLGQQRAWLMNHGAVVYGPVPVSTGRPGYATPSGVFHVMFKNAHFWSTEFNAPMPYSVFFYSGDAFHEGSVHVPSHGCVHLTQASAIRFFNYLSPGDEVQIVP